MNLLSKALVLSSLLAPAAMAFDENPVAQMILKAKNWNDLIVHLDALPTPVVTKMKRAVGDLEFPAARMLKTGLVITQSDGEKLTLKFGPEGSILINGKPWEFHPLDPADKEIARLAEFLSGGKGTANSLLTFFIPEAKASGALNGTALAGVAFAGSSKARADACTEEDLSDGMVRGCTLRAVPMLPVVPVNLGRKPDSEKDDSKLMLPVALECPGNNPDGIGTLIEKSKTGHFLRIRVTFDKKTGIATKVEAAGGTVTESFKDIVVFDPRGDGKNLIPVPNANQSNLTEAEKKKLHSFRKEIAARALAKYDAVRNEVCRGTAERQAEYLEFLKANRAKTAVQKSNFQADESTEIGAQ